MKKVVAICVTFALLIPSVCALAESIDLDAMTLDQLISLELAVQKKIYEQDPMAKCVLYPGTYAVGADIDSGDYLVQCVSLMPDEKYVRLIHRDANGEHLEEPCLDTEEACRIRFEEGQDLKILYGVVTITNR